MRLLGTLSLLGWVITPGCWGLYCPDEVHPSVGGSLSVSCQYKQGLEKYSKFWCKETARIYCSALVKSQSDGKGIKQRISIRDNKEKQYFEVIMRNLTKEDSGVYRCGIDDSLLLFRDSTCRIHVAVSPAPTLDPEEEQTTSKPTEKLQTTKRHKKLAPTEPPDSDSFTEGTSESSSFSASTRFFVRMRLLAAIAVLLFPLSNNIIMFLGDRTITDPACSILCHVVQVLKRSADNRRLLKTIGQNPVSALHINYVTHCSKWPLRC
nr:CMRF35-like molecule 6 isoform X2 [Pogona vitticeps]